MRRFLFCACLAAAASLGHGPAARAGTVWWEGEHASRHTFPRSRAFAPATAQEKEKLSGGAWLSTDRAAGATAEWRVCVPKEGTYGLWCRKFWKHGPFRWRWNRRAWRTCGRDAPLADSVVLRRHVCANWVFLGEVDLPRGMCTLEVELLPDAGAAAFDCWALADGPFLPNGPLRPGQRYGRAEPGWFAFEPQPLGRDETPALDLRQLNQSRAGCEGFVRPDGENLAFEKTGRTVRFWGVNLDPRAHGRASVGRLARRLARAGVNLVRVHGPAWSRDGRPDAVDPAYLDRVHHLVHAMAREGIYTALSFFFPLWFTAGPGQGLPGYRALGQARPFGLLFFHPRLQALHRAWARGLLAPENPYTGRPLARDPAVAVVEIVNEDNLFFWTFRPYETVPGPCMAPLERAYAAWLAERYGSLDRARRAWGGDPAPVRGDAPDEGRMGLYPAGTLGTADGACRARNEERARDQVRFLTGVQRGFFEEARRFLRDDLGFGGTVTAGNGTTADDRNLGALDKYACMAAGLMDRHAYFGGRHEGEAASFDLREGQRYRDRSALREPMIVAAGIQYGGRPHMMSEYGYPMPNRFRAEAPVLAAAYGRLSGTDAVVFFGLGSDRWLHEHRRFDLAVPSMLGQFPAMALAFRRDYLLEGPVIRHTPLALDDLYRLDGRSPVQPRGADPFRTGAAGAGDGGARKNRPGLLHELLVGRVTVSVAEKPGMAYCQSVQDRLSLERRCALSATDQLFLDWGQGLLCVDAPAIQGAVGFWASAGRMDFFAFEADVENEYASLFLVSLDGRPLASSKRMLLQVMTEDRNYGWRTRQGKGGMQRIEDLGAPPVMVREVRGSVRFRRREDGRLWTTPLDAEGRARDRPRTHPGRRLVLLRDCLHYRVDVRDEEGR